MNKQVEIFENEEATKFLDYFVTYMKLMDKVDNIKNMATQQNAMILLEPEAAEAQKIGNNLTESPLAMDDISTLLEK
jgi:hypothetical protein